MANGWCIVANSSWNSSWQQGYLTLLLLVGWILLLLRLECLAKKLKQVVPLWLFPRIKRNILGVIGAKTLLRFVISKDVWLSDKKRARVKPEKRISRLQAMIKTLRGCACCHYFKLDFLLLFKYTSYQVSVGWLGRGRDKDSKLRRQSWIYNEKLVEYVVNITAYLVPHYSLHILRRRLTILCIVNWIGLVGKKT